VWSSLRPDHSQSRLAAASRDQPSGFRAAINLRAIRCIRSTEQHPLVLVAEVDRVQEPNADKPPGDGTSAPPWAPYARERRRGAIVRSAGQTETLLATGVLPAAAYRPADRPKNPRRGRGRGAAKAVMRSSRKARAARARAVYLRPAGIRMSHSRKSGSCSATRAIVHPA
jgi:hypothetical protein